MIHDDFCLGGIVIAGRFGFQFLPGFDDHCVTLILNTTLVYTTVTLTVILILSLFWCC